MLILLLGVFMSAHTVKAVVLSSRHSGVEMPSIKSLHLPQSRPCQASAAVMPVLLIVSITAKEQII